MISEDRTISLIAEDNTKLWARRFFEMIGTVSLVTIILNGEGKILYVNDFFLRLTGWKLEEIMGKSWLDLFIPEDIAATMQQLFSDCICGEKVVSHYENEILTRHGERRLVRWSNTWWRDQEGNIEGTASIGEDITDQNLAREKLQAHEQRLRALAAELASTEDRERMRLATMLHEGVAQSLAAAKMEAHLPGLNKLPPKAERALGSLRQRIEESITQVRELMSNLSPPVGLLQEFATAVSWLADRLGARYHAAVKVEDDQKPKPLEQGMKSLLVSAVRELVMNAIRHGGAKRITISTNRLDASVEIRVKDDGIGFDVWNLGENLDATGGFGLFNLRERLLFNGGSFQIISAPGEGTEAVIHAPLSGNPGEIRADKTAR